MIFEQAWAAKASISVLGWGKKLLERPLDLKGGRERLGADLGRRTGVVFVHVFGGCGFSITAELVRPATTPPTACSTIAGTFS
jgi:hypothetical protein